MESQRTFLTLILAFVSVLLYMQWDQDQNPPPQTQTVIEQNVQQDHSSNNYSTATSINSDVPVTELATVVTPVSSQTITVETDTLIVTINTQGGDITSAKLKQYKVAIDSDEPLEILKSTNTHLYVAQSGLTGRDGPDASRKGRPIYHSDHTAYTMAEGQELQVPLTWQDSNGFKVTKTFVFKPNKYDIKVTYDIVNSTDEVKEIRHYSQLKQTMIVPESSLMMPTYTGAAYSTKEEPYEKYSYDDIASMNLNQATQGGWVAMLQHYFLSAWVPEGKEVNNIYSSTSAGSTAIIGIKSPLLSLQPGESQSTSATLYVGPKTQKELNSIEENLHLTVDYGPLWLISELLFQVMQFAYELVPNWGFAIIAVTIVVKLALYFFTKKQYVSMAKMRNLQPKLAQLKDKYGDDRQRMGQAMMELYRKEKVNPMEGCLPLLIQMPIFLALYWMFMESVELRHSPFIFWIEDLSAFDPYFVLPVLYGLSMFMMQKLQPTPATDPMQQKIMLWLPVVFSVLFVIFPAGLVLYWVVNNIISVMQMLWIYRQMEKSGIVKKN